MCAQIDGTIEDISMGRNTHSFTPDWDFHCFINMTKSHIPLATDVMDKNKQLYVDRQVTSLL